MFSNSKTSLLSYLRVGLLLTTLATSYPSQQVFAQQADTTSISKAIGNDNVLKLTEAIRVALANNSDIKRSLLSLKNADEQVQLAWSDVLPKVNASASYTRNLEIPVNFVPAKFFDSNAGSDELVPLQFGTDNNWQGGISVSQTLFRGEAFVGISSSKLFKAAQAENMRATTQKIVTQTRLAYYNVLVSKEQYRLQKVTLKRLRKNLDENASRRKAGLLDEYAVMQVEVQLRNQEPQLTQAKYSVEEAYRKLKMVLGIPLSLDFLVQGDLSKYEVTAEKAAGQLNENIKRVDRITPYQYVAKSSKMDTVTNLRGDIRVLSKQNQLKDREIKAIKSRFLPTLTANYNLNWNASQPGEPVFFGSDETRARSQTVGLTFSLPIFQGFERTANLDIAQIEKKDLEEQKRAAMRSAKNEIQSAEEALNEAIETAPARQKALDLAREGYRRARVRLENGLGSQLDVTNAELQFREAEVNYSQMVYNYLSAKARYDQATGMVPFVDKGEPTLNE